MSKVYSLLKEAGVFWVNTVSDGRPASRPFGAVAEIDGALYISTGKQKKVYAQLVLNPAVQITAMLPNSRNWLRVDARVVETGNRELKQIMLNDCPNVKKHFSSADSPDFALFEIAETEAYLYTNSGVKKLPALQTLTFAPYDLKRDREFLAAAHAETFALTFRQEISADALETELTRSRDMRDGAYLGDQLIGICDLQIRSRDDIGEYVNVAFFFIAPEYRDNGFGGQLITHAAEWCEKLDKRILHLRTAKDNYRAQKCYENNGFERFTASDTENEFGYMKLLSFS